MINSHLLYRLSYRGTTVRILLFGKEKSTLQQCAGAGREVRRGPGASAQSTWTMASVTVPRLLRFSAAAQMRPVLMA